MTYSGKKKKQKDNKWCQKSRRQNHTGRGGKKRRFLRVQTNTNGYGGAGYHRKGGIEQKKTKLSGLLSRWGVKG